MLNLPGVESTEEEDDQTYDALSVPPLHVISSAVSRGLSGAGVWHQTQQTGVAPTIYYKIQTHTFAELVILLHNYKSYWHCEQ